MEPIHSHLWVGTRIPLFHRQFNESITQCARCLEGEISKSARYVCFRVRHAQTTQLV
jgi:hypothetical protein